MTWCDIICGAQGLTVLFVAHEDVSLARLKDAMDREDGVGSIPIRVVLELPCSEYGVGFTTYEIWNAGRWNYTPHRHYLKTIMLFCEITGLHYDGVLLPDDMMNSFVYGDIAALCLNRHRNLWYPKQLLWNDDRNTERAELPTLRSFYKEQKMTNYEIAIKQPWRVDNWQDVSRRGITIRSSEEQ